MKLSEQEKIRREKLAELIKLGINPYPAKLYPVDHLSNDIKTKFSENKKVIIAGRIMSRRKRCLHYLSSMAFSIIWKELKSLRSTSRTLRDDRLLFKFMEMSTIANYMGLIKKLKSVKCKYKVNVVHIPPIT